MPTAPLAPLAAKLRDPEVRAFFAKIAIFATEGDVARPHDAQTVEKVAFSTQNRKIRNGAKFRNGLEKLSAGSKFLVFGGVETSFTLRLGSKSDFFNFQNHPARVHVKNGDYGRKIDTFSKNLKIQKISNFLTYSTFPQPQ